MKVKFFEIRDAGTTIPAVGFRLPPNTPVAAAFLERGGFGGGDYVFLMKLLPRPTVQYEPLEWGGRTMPVAHHWIARHFDEMSNGHVVDVEFILGERAAPKFAEIT